MKRSEMVQKIAEAIHKDDGGQEWEPVSWIHRDYAEAALKAMEDAGMKPTKELIAQEGLYDYDVVEWDE